MIYKTGTIESNGEPVSNWASSGAKHEGSVGGYFANGPHVNAFTFTNEGAGDKLLVVKTSASYDGVVDVLVGTTAGADDLANIDDITPGNIGSRTMLEGLEDGVEYHVTVTADADADTESIEWCVVDPFYIPEIPDNRAHANEYDRIIPNTKPFDFTTWENPNDLTLALIFAEGETEIVYGHFQNPQTLTLQDLETRLFEFSGLGWFPVVEDSSQLYRELSSWTVNGTSTRIHKPELIGNVEVVGVEDTETGATRYIWKETDLPLDGPRYVRLRVRINAANTTSMMFRAARPSNPCELIIDLATGEAHTDQSGTAPIPVVFPGHITSDFAEYLVRFPKLEDATLWQFYPAVGPNGITNRNGYAPASVGRVDLELLTTNAAPEATGNALYQWFFENYPVLGTDRGSVLPYSGIEGKGVEFKDAGNDNFVIIGDTFQINEPTFRVSLDIRKETNGNSFYTDLRDVNNELNRLVFNPTSGNHSFTGTGGGTATARDDGDRWHVEIEFNVPLQGDHRVDIVSDWTAGGGSQSSMVLYDFRLFAKFEDSGQTIITSGQSGVELIRIDEPEDLIPVVSTVPIVTSHDLTKYKKGKIEFHFEDQTGSHKWQSIEVDIQDALRRYELGLLTSSGSIFDNDFQTFNLTDPKTGTFVINDNGRELSYIRSDLFVYAQTALKRIDVFNNPDGQTLTTAYTDYGGPQDALALVTDGDQIEFLYGDGTASNGIFIDGVANVGREGGLALEAQVTGNQLQARAEAGSAVSTVDRITIFRRSIVGSSGPSETPGSSPSTRIGEMIFASSKDTNKTLANGYLEVKEGTVAGGAIDYPLWAAMYPEFVSGDDIVFPLDVNGMFLRNLGTGVSGFVRANAEGVFQNYQVPFHSHSMAPAVHSTSETGAVSGNGGDGNAARVTVTSTSGSSTHREGLVANRAYQLYTIVDTYREVPVVIDLVETSLELGENAKEEGFTLEDDVLELTKLTPLRREFDSWNTTNNEIEYELINGVEHAVFTDDRTDAFNQSSSTETPIPAPNESMDVTFTYLKDAGNTDVALLFLEGEGDNEAIFSFSYQNTDTNVEGTGTGIAPEVLQSSESEKYIQHTVRFFGNANPERWHFSAAISIEFGVQPVTSATGTLKIKDIVFGSEEPLYKPIEDHLFAGLQLFDTKLEAQIALPANTPYLLPDHGLRVRPDTGGRSAIPTLSANVGALTQNNFQDQFNRFVLSGNGGSVVVPEFQALIENVPYATIDNLRFEINGNVQPEPVNVITDDNGDGTYTHLLYGFPVLPAFQNFTITNDSGDGPDPAGNGSGVSFYLE